MSLWKMFCQHVRGEPETNSYACKQVGEPGLGKELFIKNAFAAYCEDNDLPVNSCPPETTADAFTRSHADFCTDIVLEVDSSQSKIHYIIQV